MPGRTLHGGDSRRSLAFHSPYARLGAVLTIVLLPFVALLAVDISTAPARYAATSSIVRYAPQPTPPAAEPSDEPGEAPPAAPVPAPIASSAPATRSAEDATGDRILFVEPEKWSAGSHKNVTEALRMLPAAVRSRLGNAALGPLYVEVNTTGSTLSGKQPYGRAANFFSTNEGRNEVVLYPNQSPMTVLHELGHAYNLRNLGAGRYALVLLEPEMKGFLSASGWSVLTPPEALATVRDQMDVKFARDDAQIWPRVSHDDPLEDFANSFALYFGNPAELQSLSPARYAWFAANVGP